MEYTPIVLPTRTVAQAPPATGDADFDRSCRKYGLYGEPVVTPIQDSRLIPKAIDLPPGTSIDLEIARYPGLDACFGRIIRERHQREALVVHQIRTPADLDHEGAVVGYVLVSGAGAEIGHAALGNEASHRIMDEVANYVARAIELP